MKTIVTYLAIAVWFILTIALLGGEDSPEAPMSIGRFMLLKGLGIISLFLFAKTTTWLYRTGRLETNRPDEK